MMSNLVFKALSDPTRRQILRLLADGEKCAGELVDVFPISGPSMSHHFAALKAAGLVRARKEGQKQIYTLDTTVVQDAAALLLEFLRVDASQESNLETRD